MRKLLVTTIVISLIIVNCTSPHKPNDHPNLDKYGGNKNLHFEIENNGFFRTTFQDGRWWLVTPENNAFLSIGLNHFHSHLWLKEYNKLHWEKVFGGKAGTAEWGDGFYAYAKNVVTVCGANTLAYHNEEPILLQREPLLPYIKQFLPVKISFHMRASAEDYVDIFSPEFEQICDSAAQEQVAPYVNDKRIIGFAMTDIPVLTEGWAEYTVRYGFDIPTWARVLRNLPTSSPGKQEYVKTMKDKYASIVEFNNTYETGFTTWSDLLEAENWRLRTDFKNEKEVADNDAFNKLCISKYYEVSLKSFRKVNKNHLFLGDKLNANVNKRDLEIMIDATKDYVDVVLYQFFGKDDYQKEYQDLIASVSNLPMINGDGGFGAYGDPKMPNPQDPKAKNQNQRAEWMAKYAEDAFSNPNFVGWHICGIIDSWSTAPHGTQKAGIMNPLGEKHQVVIDTLASLSERIYEISSY